MKKLFVILVFSLFSVMVFAEDITVVYLDRTETNLEASSFLKKEAKASKLNYRFIYTMDFNKLKGTEPAIVILNSGRTSGIDPRIDSFISSYPKKESIILVNLYRMGNNTLNASVAAADSLYGVDELSAATVWKDFKRGKDNSIYEMHKQWTSELFVLLNTMLVL